MSCDLFHNVCMLIGMTCVDVLCFTLFETLMVLTNSRNSLHRWLTSTFTATLPNTPRIVWIGSLINCYIRLCIRHSFIKLK